MCEQDEYEQTQKETAFGKIRHFKNSNGVIFFGSFYCKVEQKEGKNICLQKVPEKVQGRVGSKNALKNEQLTNLNLGFRTNNHSICGKLRKMSFMKTKTLRKLLERRTS